MDIFDYSIKTTENILKEFATDLQKGLAKKEVSKRLTECGENCLVFKELNGWKIFLRQFKSAFIYLLLVAMVITLLLGEVIDTLMIFIFLSINTFLGFYQEYRSEKTAQLLSQYNVPKTKVLRSRVVELIPSPNLVPGDIIILETGDKIPADVRILTQNDLMVDETILTGESLAVYKNENVTPKKPASYHEASNLGFAGTYILNGKAIAVVLATGKNTVFGKIAKLTTETRKISDFEKGISRFSNFILKLVGLTLVIIFAANILIKKGELNLSEFIIFSIALTVSVIPEALPLVTTFSLSMSAARLAKQKVIVKRLSAVEDLGGIEILCTDKTGTLTKNELTFANINSREPTQTLVMANLAGAFEQKNKSEPFDIALWQKLDKEQQMQIEKAVKIKEEPFNPETRRDVVLFELDGHRSIVTRGAPEVVLNLCRNIDDKARESIEEWIASEGKKGHRVLGVAFKSLNDEVAPELLKEDDFDFSGIISFVDPIKFSTFDAVKKARHLGVKIMILTGDSLEVAGAVACEIGLIDSPGKVISGQVWHNMSHLQQAAALSEYSVFARVSPLQKYKIIELLRERYTVGFLGEGINDAPALKIAGVSLVVDSAADIAREVSDIILLKKSLGVILLGIEEGRKVFANTTKYIKATLASNFGNFFAIATASLMVDFLPMLPIQILLVNLLSDTPMISISTDTVDKKELVSPRKYEVKDIVLLSLILGVVSSVFDFIFFGLFYRISPSALQTNWFIGSILTELVLIFSIRTRVLFFKAARPSTPLVVLSILVFIATIGLPFTAFGQNVFHFTTPSFSYLLLILGIVLIYFTCSEVIKLKFYKNGHH